jgi:putative glycerol-1-phosphate prenyltransferase
MVDNAGFDGYGAKERFTEWKHAGGIRESERGWTGNRDAGDGCGEDGGPADFARRWRHAFKLDPDRPVSDEALRRIAASGTDGIIVGGSSGVTEANTAELLARIRRAGSVAVALEVSSLEAVVPGFDGYFIPLVLNSRNRDFIIGRHLEAIRRFGPFMPWDRMAVLAYIILNPDSTAARVAEADMPRDAADVLAMADLADKLLKLPYVYVEYSGTYGDMDLVRQVKNRLVRSRLAYGGGIAGPEQAAAAARHADLTVVGNALYHDLDRALATVRALVR